MSEKHQMTEEQKKLESILLNYVEKCAENPTQEIIQNNTIACVADQLIRLWSLQEF